MPRKPNYQFERQERERIKAIKTAEKANAKRAERERAEQDKSGGKKARGTGGDGRPRAEQPFRSGVVATPQSHGEQQPAADGKITFLF